MKWSKTIQNQKDVVVISLPLLGPFPLGRISALKSMGERIPAQHNDPIFVLPRRSQLIAVTDSVARKHLKSISQCLQPPTPLTFYAFSRSGTYWAFHNGVPLEFNLKAWDMEIRCNSHIFHF